MNGTLLFSYPEQPRVLDKMLSSGEGIEKIFTFDIMPRLIIINEWALIQAGLRGRLKAFNFFLKDTYHWNSYRHYLEVQQKQQQQ